MEGLAVAFFIIVIGGLCRKAERKNSLLTCRQLTKFHDSWSSDMNLLIKEASKSRDDYVRLVERLSKERKTERDELIGLLKRKEKNK